MIQITHDMEGKIPPVSLLVRAALTLLTTLTLAACWMPAPALASRAGSHICPGYAHTRSKIGLNEVQGVAPHGSLWALLFYAPPAATHTTEKIVIRMTGSGPLHIEADGPRGGTVHPYFGPEPHTGSNWIRPGDEWGTGWRFPGPGCWRLHASRRHAIGDIWLRVVQRTKSVTR